MMACQQINLFYLILQECTPAPLQTLGGIHCLTETGHRSRDRTSGAAEGNIPPVGVKMRMQQWDMQYLIFVDKFVNVILIRGVFVFGFFAL